MPKLQKFEIPKLLRLRDQVRRSSNVMRQIARFMPASDLLTSGFRDVIGVKAALREKVKTGKYDKLLITAVRRGLSDIVELLLDAGADKDVIDYFGDSPLHFAAKKGHTDIVKLLLDAGADKDVKSKTGYTPLHFAAEKGHTDIVKLLLDAGVDKEVKDKNGYTPLHDAAWNCRTDIVKLLLDAGADKDVKNQYGSTPLDLAVAHRRLFGLDSVSAEFILNLLK